jgi:hypothetical protein
MGAQGFAIVNHELKNPQCANRMKFVFTAVQVTDVISGKQGRFHG